MPLPRSGHDGIGHRALRRVILSSGISGNRSPVSATAEPANSTGKARSHAGSFSWSLSPICPVGRRAMDAELLHYGRFWQGKFRGLPPAMRKRGRNSCRTKLVCCRGVNRLIRISPRGGRSCDGRCIVRLSGGGRRCGRCSRRSALSRPDVGLRAGPPARLRCGVAARASFQRLLSDAKPAADDGAYRGQISRPVAGHLGAGVALVSSAAAGRRNRHAQPADPRHLASRYRARHRADGIQRLQHRHERGPRALRRSVRDRRAGAFGRGRSAIKASSGTSSSRSASAPIRQTSQCASMARSAARRAPR